MCTYIYRRNEYYDFSTFLLQVVVYLSKNFTPYKYVVISWYFSLITVYDGVLYLGLL